MLYPPNQTVSTPHRVVITGAGIVTALGVGWRANADGFRAGRTAFRPVTLFDVARQRTKIAAEVDLPPAAIAEEASRKAVRRRDRATRLLLLAAREAWWQAGWEPGAEAPMVLGTTSGGMALGEAYLAQALERPRQTQHQATRIVHYQAQRQGLEVAGTLGCRGPITVIANACASGTNALGHAWDLLRTGRAERALAGGYDALCQLTFAGFDSLQALSPTECRPFDVGRDGLTLGEGAALFTLETLARARRRDVEILGEIIGYGAATDTYHLTQPHPEGDAACATMAAACACAGIGPSEIDYVNAHGTGTPANDGTEAIAINRWAGARVSTLPVSSTKAGIGHLLGAAGAAEAMACLMAIHGQWLPPQRALAAPDPACQFRIVQAPADARIDVALSNSFGFGGANASLILRRWS